MKKIGVLIGLCLALSTGAAAQVGADHPGYYSIEEMGIFARDELEVDVDLQGALLQAVSGSMNGQQGDMADLIAGLERVRVQVGNPRTLDPSTIEFRVQEAVANLEASGWVRNVRVEDDGEQVYLFSRESGGMIVGVTVLVNDEADEVVLVNIVGSIDPVTFGKALSQMDTLPDLDELVAGSN